MGECLLGSLVINLLALLKHQFGHHVGRHPTSSKLPDPIVFPGRRYGDGNGAGIVKMMRCGLRKRGGDRQGGPLVATNSSASSFSVLFLFSSA